MLLNGAWIGHTSMLLVLHGGAETATVTLPQVPGLTAYQRVWDSTQERPGSTWRSRPRPPALSVPQAKQ